MRSSKNVFLGTIIIAGSLALGGCGGISFKGIIASIGNNFVKLTGIWRYGGQQSSTSLNLDPNSDQQVSIDVGGAHIVFPVSERDMANLVVENPSAVEDMVSQGIGDWSAIHMYSAGH